MSDGPLHFTKRELQAMLVSPRFWGAIAGASVLLGIIGPFGTWEAMRLPARLAYWSAVAVATYLVGAGTTHFLSRVVPLPSWPSAARYGLYGALAGIPATLVVWGVNAAVFPGSQGIAFLPLLAATVVIAAIVSAVVASLSAQLASTAHRPRPVTVPEAPQRPVILDRLPPHLRGELSHMSMQDHYVDIHTDRGGTLVLMRLSDAIAETSAVEGLQIHRSHWVAVAAVAGSVQVGGRLMLKLRDGTLLPVSRSYLSAVRAAGLG